MGRKRSNGKRARGNGTSTVPVPRAPLDFTHFSNRRNIKYAVDTDMGSEFKLLGINRSGISTPTGASPIPGVQTLLTTFTSIRLTSIELWFDARGTTGSTTSQAAVPRCGAFLLVGLPSTFDGTKLADAALWAGRGLNQINPSRPLRLRVGPELDAGRFGSPDFANSLDTLVIKTLGYTGNVRVVFNLQTLGTPQDLTASA